MNTQTTNNTEGETVYQALNADTGEQGFQEEQHATTIVSKYLPVITPVQYTPSDIAERIIKKSIADGTRENMSEKALANKTTEIAVNLTELVKGYWNKNKCLKSLDCKSGVFLVSGTGDYELDNHAIAFVELPDDSFTARLVGKYAVLRFMPERKNYAGRDWQYPVNDKNQRGIKYLDSPNMPWALLEGVLGGYNDLASATIAFEEVVKALATLRSAEYKRARAEMSDSERAVAQYEADERRLEALARQPKQEPAI